MDFEFFSKNGKVLSVKEATVSLMDIEYSYGFGVYETLRVSKGLIYFLSDHVDRLFQSAQLIGLEHSFTKEEVKRCAVELAKTTTVSSFNLKIVLVGGYSPKDASLYIFCSNPLFPSKDSVREGVSLHTAIYERWQPRAKSLNMLPSYVAYKNAKGAGCYDALLIDHNGFITEGTRTNFFFIKDTVIYSAPENNILSGITRKFVLKTAEKIGFEIMERNIKVSEITNFDGAFITSTGQKIIPVRKIDDFEYEEIPQNLKRLMEAFDDFLVGLH